jgi:hypothetical protein
VSFDFDSYAFGLSSIAKAANQKRNSWSTAMAQKSAHKLGLGILLVGFSLTLWAGHTVPPSSVTIAGSLQDELGCPGDWQPDCAATHLGFDSDDDVWQGTFNVPAGSWEYKATLNDSWDENYGQGGVPGGANISLNLGAATDVKFYYDHKTHWITDNVNSAIATAPGNYQDELGCPGDWQPDCLRSWLQDPDGDGVFTFSALLPGGDYEAKAAISESWDENYGQGGAPGGANILFNVPGTFAEMLFTFDYATKILTIGLAPPPLQPASVTIVGDLQDELGCPGDWQPDCVNTHLAFDAEDTVWQESFALPAGTWQYKATLNNSWDENYGANAQRDGPNINLDLTTRHIGSRVISTPSLPLCPVASKASWVAPATGIPRACAPGCRIPTATVSMHSRLTCPPASMK